MSEDSSQEQPNDGDPVNPIAADTVGSAGDAKKSEASSSGPGKIIVRLWPKTPVLYPVGICALIFAILSYFFGAHRPLVELADYDEKAKTEAAVVAEVEAQENGGEKAEDRNKFLTIPDEEFTKLQSRVSKGFNFDCVLGFAFLILFTYALFTVCVDFEVRWALISVFFVIILILSLIIANLYNQFLPDFISSLFSLTPTASPQFYLAIFVIWLSLMIVTLVVVRFHYVKIESNEVVVVGGFLEKQKRYSTFRMRYVKEIKDVMEYYLPFVRSGRLIFTFPGVEEPLVLDNVLNIDRVIRSLDRLSSRLNVEEHGGEM
ncbi:MAG: hypothetical protein AAGA58_08435 [Verrucomicrobiota bacterium]